MAAIRPRGPLAIGSQSWINDENAQVERHYEQEVEDFSFSARNEFEWLNEHMADVFAKEQLSFADILKTPGKLRGKTPRTTKKRNPLEIREPLSTIFGNTSTKLALSNEGPPKSPLKTVSVFAVAEDASEKLEASKFKKSNADSGYHGMSQDETELNRISFSTNTHFEPTKAVIPSPRIGPIGAAQTEDRSTTERSFHSAREEVTRTVTVETEKPLRDSRGPAEQDERPYQGSQDDLRPMEVDMGDNKWDEDLVATASHTPSQGSTPERPLVRKSSLTFAALPAREPLTTKKSIGARPSQNGHLDQQRGSTHHNTFLGRITGGKSLGGVKGLQDEHEITAQIDSALRTAIGDEVSDDDDAKSRATKLHNKSSTQRLHDKINQLSQPQTHRPTKSIPSTALNTSQPIYPNLPSQEVEMVHESELDAQDPMGHKFRPRSEEDEDWIQPPESINAEVHKVSLKEAEVYAVESEGGKFAMDNESLKAYQKPSTNNKVSSPLPHASLRTANTDGYRIASDSQKDSPGIYSSYNGVKTFDEEETANWTVAASTTPLGSPMGHRHLDGTLNASKSKLQSIMKTARGLFSSSAGVSAQAKMEALPGKTLDFQGHQDLSHESRLDRDSVRKPHDQSTWIPPKTRSSTETEDREKQQSKAEPVSSRTINSGRENRQDDRDIEAKTSIKIPMTTTASPAPKPTRQSPRKTREPEPISLTTGGGDVPPPANAQTIQTQNRPPQSQRSKEPRRPVRPAKDSVPKPKPQPVAIRVGVPSGRVPLSNSVLSSTLSESLAQPPKPPAPAKNTSLQSSTSNSNLKSSVSSGTTKPKALLAAERKKEQDEKEAQRKLELKKDNERKRAAQLEEAKKQEQIHRQEIEKQRERERALVSEDAKKLAQRQAIEKRRLDLSKKDQQRVPQRPNVEQGVAGSRGDVAGSRPPSRQHHGAESLRPVNNTLAASKSGIKRVIEVETDVAPTRPRTQGAPTYQQNDSKRRRTESEETEEFPMRPTHAPPIRQSMRKDAQKPSTFVNTYSTAPPPASHNHNGLSLLKSATSSQAYQQHPHQGQVMRPGNYPDMKQYMTGKIPFAEHPNPPAQASQHQQAHQLGPQATSKTPHQSKTPAPKTFSPQYPNGENIQLDDIPTDSEDESDSEASTSANNTKAKPSNLPDWAQSPNLRQILETQDERMDADTVFGPVQSPHIEEMFKERQHRFRNRTSSANWAGADRLTEEEIRRDVEARRKLRRDGGWTFGL